MRMADLEALRPNMVAFVDANPRKAEEATEKDQADEGQDSGTSIALFVA